MDTAINQNEQGNPQLSDTKLNVIQPHLTWNYHVYVICYGTSHISTDNYYYPSQQEAGLKSGLTTGRFQPILEKLTNLERDHPKLAFQAARAIGLYRYISASCVSLSLDNEKLDRYGQAFIGASVNLHDAKDGLQPCPNKQLSRFIALNGV